MAIRIMTHVWENSKHKGSALLLLLAIADMASDDGTCYPGIQRLSKKTRMSERNVQINLKVLTKGGELEIDYNQGVHTKTGYTNLYIVKFPEQGERQYLRGQGVKSISPLKAQGVKNDSPLGVKSISPESSVEPSVKEETKDSVPATQHAPSIAKKTTIPKSDMDAMKNAIVAALRWDVDVISKTQWGTIQKTAKELIQIGCKLDEVVHLRQECDNRKYRGYGAPALAKVAVDVLPRIRKQVNTSTPTDQGLAFGAAIVETGGQDDIYQQMLKRIGGE
jgi:hypothetical protein